MKYINARLILPSQKEENVKNREEWAIFSCLWKALEQLVVSILRFFI